MCDLSKDLNPRDIVMYECCHLVCKAEGLLLNNIILFKNHVEMVHEIRLRDEKEVSSTAGPCDIVRSKRLCNLCLLSSFYKYVV
jgi:hypothetical protein